MTPQASSSIAAFLASHHPFDQLAPNVLDELSLNMKAREVTAGAFLATPDAPLDHMYVVKSGHIEVRGADKTLLAKLEEGDVFGHHTLLSDAPGSLWIEAVTRATLLLLPASSFDRMCRDHASFRYHFGARKAVIAGGSGAAGKGAGDAGLQLMHTPIAQIVTRDPVTVSSATSIREAAGIMSRERISSLLVVDNGALTGIVTDRDLRSRVIAAGRSLDDAVKTVMSTSPATIEASDHAYEALLMMARSNYHHLPVLDGSRLVGMITDTDLLQRHSTSPLYLIGEIHRCKDKEALAQASTRLKQLMLTLVEANATSDSVGRVVSSIGEAITGRLLSLAEQQLGPPPVPYAWLTGGSLARFEQTALSDQDNCLLIDDGYSPQAHGEYFKTLSEDVCEGLNRCGYVYCPGEIMAMTDKWRQPLQQWKKYFDTWVDQPEPKALMHACIFFDLRRLHGDVPLFTQLQDYVLAKAQTNAIFHAFMAGNALTHQPPLGFFRNFVLVKDGEHDKTLDLKHSGVIPIVDIARVYALAGGIVEVNTRERLLAAEEKGLMSADSASDLRDALEFIGTVRLRHQAGQIRQGIAPDNFVPPSALSHLERKHLKDAFGVVRTMQSYLGQRYQTGHLG